MMKRNSLAFRLYWIAVAVVFLWAGFMRFRIPGWPLADLGSWGYLRAAVSKLAGGAFEHSGGRNFLYPGFLYLILAATRTFRAITVVQHLLGLGTGALLLLSWNKTRRFLHAVPLGVHCSLGIAIAAIYLLAVEPIAFEHQLRPESITPFFAILNIFLTLRLLELRDRVGPSFSLALTTALLLVNSVLLVTIKTSFGLTILFAAIPIVAVLFDRRENWRRRLAVLGVGVIAVAAVALPERALAKSDPTAHSFMATSLFTIHANYIIRQMDEDLAKNECGPYPCAWLGEVASSLHQEMATSWEWRKRYRSFHFDPDYLMYNPNSLALWTDRFFGGDREKQLDFYRFYYARTLRRHPGWIVGKVLSQMGLFYRLYNPGFAPNHSVRLRFQYQQSRISFELPGVKKPDYAPFNEYLKRCLRLSNTHAVIRQPALIRPINWLLSVLYLPVLLAVMAAGIGLAFAPHLRSLHKRFFGATCLVYCYNFGNNLGTALVHSLHVQRYTRAQHSFTLLSECIGLLFLIELALMLLRRDPAGVPNELITRSAS